MRYQLLAALCLIFLIMAMPQQTIYAQTQISEPQVEYTFGDQIIFTAKLNAEQEPQTALVFFQAEKDTHTHVGQAQITSLAENTYELRYTYSLTDYAPRAFSQVDYRWEVNFEAGEAYKSPSYQFDYLDNRFAWNTLEEEPFRIYWYEGDVPFAQSILDAAQKGLQQVHNLLQLPVPSGLDIYVYADSKTLQSALSPNSESWVAGHAEPDLGVIVVALPPGPDQRLLIEQRIPHELMHVLLYQATDLGYDNLPTWLSEGLASLAELYPNSDYQVLLDNAVEKDSLIPMIGLCQSFPRQASSALLAYAQSASFTRYLYNSFGTSGLQELVTAYANGLDCQRGAQKALKKNITRLEYEWQRDELSKDVVVTAFNNLLPWLVLLSVILLAPIILVVRRLHTAAAQQPAGQRTP
jgi:hypothetical protein